MAADPVCTDPDKYQVIFENDRVRVLEYRDLPGGKTLPHQHPDSVMYTLSAFQRRLHVGQGRRDVVMEPGISGVELAREAKRLRKGIKILLTSGNAMAILERHRAVDEFPIIGKPFRRADLAHRLRSILDDRSG